MRRAPIAPTHRALVWLPLVAIPPVLIADAAMDGQSVTALGVLAAFVACTPLLWRERLGFPLMAPLIVGGVMLAVWQLEPHSTVVLIPMVALYDVVKRGTRARTLWSAAAAVPCVFVSILPFADDAADFVAVFVPNLALTLLGVAAGEAARVRDQAAEQAADAREQEALRRAGEERLHIEQEVHDTVAHAMVAINVQAGVAAHLLDRDHAHAHAALREIKATSGEALAQLRSTLGVLRDADAAAPVRPAGRLDAIEELAAPLRTGGIDVKLTLPHDAALATLPPALHAAGYRIVQEALTNVLRHAQAPRVAEVSVRRENGSLLIAVRDDGGGVAGPGDAGHGVRGMRERTTALGGSLAAGPAPAGGWRVDATLPVPEP